MYEGFLDVPGMGSLCFYTCLLAIKFLSMPLLIIFHRLKKRSIKNKQQNPKTAKRIAKIDDDIERVRRAHLNDLENITVFIIVCFAYLFTNPAIHLAITLMRVYTLMRAMHTLVYAIVVVPQPTRLIAWAIGYFITIYMGIKTLVHFVLYI